MRKLAVTIEGHTYEIELDQLPNGDALSNGSSSSINGDSFTVRVDGEPVDVVAPRVSATVGKSEWYIVDDHPYEVSIDADLQWIKSPRGIFLLEVQDLEVAVSRPQTGDGRVKAPIPGQITQVLVEVGEEVGVGQPLLVLEAMKMENEIQAPRSGTVKVVNVSLSQTVTLHEVLVEIE